MLNRIIGILQPLSEKELTKSAGLWKRALLLQKNWMGRLARSTIAAAISAATTAAAISAAATAATVAAATTTAAAAWGPCFAWTRFVHRKSATFHGFAIKLGNGILCFLFCCHGHKSEAARLACEFILHKHDILHSTSLREEILKVGFRRIERKIPNV
jgi:hypothetical protein